MSKLEGNLKGLKASDKKKLEDLFKLRLSSKEILSKYLGQTLAEISSKIERDISIFLNRRGHVINITVGDAEEAKLSGYKNIREGMARLSGIRCIHTHLKAEPLTNKDFVMLAKNRLDLMIAIGVDSNSTFSKSKGHQSHFADIIYTAYLLPKADENGKLWKINDPKTLYEVSNENFEDFILSIEEDFAGSGSSKEVIIQERAILVGLYESESSKYQSEESLEELKRLTETAGAIVVDSIIQKKSSPDPSFYIGSGKAMELALIVQELNSNLVIVDAELSSRQQKNLEDTIGVKTIDRTELILDIFAQRAQTREGKLQVELAQLKYMLPRLIGAGISMSRQMGGGKSGGIATRGPGETKLEMDRRVIKSKLNQLEKEVESIRANRKVQRSRRGKQGVIVASLVGYTNSGKSTLLNALSNSKVLAEDKLFATLDPTTRRIMLSNNTQILLTDTVGFIQKLPTSLVSAFRATLEEVSEADIIIHVVDASHDLFMDHIDTVNDILLDLECANKPTITVFNKIDRLSDDKEIDDSVSQFNVLTKISALKKTGLDDLKEKLLEIAETLI